MADARQTPPLPPRLILDVFAHKANPETLATLDPRVMAGEDGWTLIWRHGRAESEASTTLAAQFELRDTALLSVRDADRTSGAARHPGNEMIRYLVWRDFSNEPNARALLGEHMVIAPRMEQADLLEIFAKLNAHATCIRASVLAHPNGEDMTLFHLRGDDRRGSTLAQFLGAYRGGRIPILNAYATNSGTAFLPVAPPVLGLTAVARLVAAAPTLFAGLTRPRSGWAPQQLLFAVARSRDFGGGSDNTGDKGIDTFFDIRSERFFGSARFTSDISGHRLQIAQSLAEPAEAARRVQERLVRPDSAFSALLTLRKTVSHAQVKADEARLATMRAERQALDRRITALSSTLKGHAVMIVARDDHFAQIAQVLRQVVGAGERWEDIRYAYLGKAPGAEPDPSREEAYHVLRFGPEMARAARLTAGLTAHKDIAFYWSDPGWAANYGRLGKIEVLVPNGYRLSPFPHSWSAADIDAHLRDIVAVWSDGAVTLEPNRHYVLQFIGVLRDGTPSISLEVYDEAQLAPLEGRTISWFNAVLAQSGARQSDELRDKLQDTETRAKLEAARVAREAELDAEIEASIAGARTAIDSAWTEFGAALTADLVTQLAGMESRAEKIAEIEAQAKALEAELAMARTTLEALRLESSAFAAAESKKTEDQTREIAAFLKSVEARSRQFDDAVKVSDSRVSVMRDKLDAIRNSWLK